MAREHEHQEQEWAGFSKPSVGPGAAFKGFFSSCSSFVKETMAAVDGILTGTEAGPPGQGGRGGIGGGPQMDWQGMLQHVLKTVTMMWVMNNVMKTFTGGPKPGASSFDAGAGGQEGNNGLWNGPVRMLWHEGTPMVLRVYLTEYPDFDRPRDHPSFLLWEERGLTFDWSKGNTREKRMNVSLTETARQNGSIYAHVWFVRDDLPWDDEESRLWSYKRIPMNNYKKKPKGKRLKALLGPPSSPSSVDSAEGDALPSSFPPSTDPSCPSSSSSSSFSSSSSSSSSSSEEADPPPTILSFWKPDLTLSLVHHWQGWPKTSQLPANLVEQMDIDPTSGYLTPVIYLNDFWLLSEHLIPLNESVAVVPLSLKYEPVGFFKWQMQTQLDQQWKAQASSPFSTSAGDSEEDINKEGETVKRMFLETNPILLVITLIVSALHMLFDMLAFKNDVAFWKENKSLEGLSLRTIVINTFFQCVIFLYLLDNDTSWMVLFSSGMGLLIEIWKVQKGMLTSLRWTDPATGARFWIPRLTFSAVESYTQNKTQEYDSEATAHLLYVVAPLMVGYAAYSLFQEEHKGWYSWAITSLTGFVYVFGFVMMTPQLYINYKLKSVAHLPWRTMVYKALNTFIDDLFAFVIKMPTMHRLSCFRDDVIFFIMLYQRYIYPVDRARVNEFGQLTQDNKESEDARALLAAAAAAGAAPAAGGKGEGEEGGREEGRASGRALATSTLASLRVDDDGNEGKEEEPQREDEQEEEWGQEVAVAHQAVHEDVEEEHEGRKEEGEEEKEGE